MAGVTRTRAIGVGQDERAVFDTHLVLIRCRADKKLIRGLRLELAPFCSDKQ